MKVVICESMKFSKKMIKVKDELKKFGHEIILPCHAEEYAEMNTSDHIHDESVKNRINYDVSNCEIHSVYQALLNYNWFSRFHLLFCVT